MHHYQRRPDIHASATAHLSLVEEGAYNRLLDWQYSCEGPLPPTHDELYRIVRATTPAERQAALSVATAWFSDGGWHPQARRDIDRRRSQAARRARPPAPAAAADPSPPPAAPPRLLAQKPVPALPAVSTEEVLEFGTALLNNRGIPAGRARPVLETLNRTLGEDRAFGRLMDCKQLQPRDPIAWLQKAAADGSPGPGLPASPCG
jgi:hypothetical protein